MDGHGLSWPYPGLIGILFSLGCFGVLTVCCLLFCVFYRCCLHIEGDDLNSTMSGFGRRARRFPYRETVTAPAVLFTKMKDYGSQRKSDSRPEVDQEELKNREESRN